MGLNKYLFVTDSRIEVLQCACCCRSVCVCVTRVCRWSGGGQREGVHQLASKLSQLVVSKYTCIRGVACPYTPHAINTPTLRRDRTMSLH